MKSSLIFIVSLLSISIFISCGEKKIQSAWMNQKITVDGVIEDWKDIPRIYEEDLNIMLGVINDHDNLILMYCFNDPALAQMIAMRGVTVWFNDESKKDKNFGISFKNELLTERGEMKREQLSNRNESRPFGKDLRDLLKSGRFTIELKDTLSDLSLVEVHGVEASVDQIEGLYCFEIKVPLSEIKKSRTTLKIPEDKQLKIGIEIGEAKMLMPDRKKDGMDIRGGGRGGGRGGMPGGDMGGPGGSPGAGRQRPDMNAKEIWATVILAEKSE